MSAGARLRPRRQESGPLELTGRSPDGAGNGVARWMVANRAVVRRYGEQNPAYEPAHPHFTKAQWSRLGWAHGLEEWVAHPRSYRSGFGGRDGVLVRTVRGGLGPQAGEPLGFVDRLPMLANESDEL